MKKMDGFGGLGSYGFIGPSKMVRPLPSRCQQDSPPTQTLSIHTFMACHTTWQRTDPRYPNQ